MSWSWREDAVVQEPPPGEPGLFVDPVGQEPRCAVLVLSGSSGRLEVDRARLLAAHGAAAAAVTYFGGPGQPPGLCEVPLETFAAALDRLARRADHLAVWGTSKGAEAALLLAATDQRVRSVIAVAPTSYVWANVGPGHDGLSRPWRSSWTRDGRPLPFVPLVEDWEPTGQVSGGGGAVAVADWYRASLAAADATQLRAAAIPVEQIGARVLLAAGRDDRVWPSVDFADQIAARRYDHGRSTTVLVGEGAGHCPVLPGEAPPSDRDGGGLIRGGTARGDADLGARLWCGVVNLLGLIATPGGVELRR